MRPRLRTANSAAHGGRRLSNCGVSVVCVYMFSLQPLVIILRCIELGVSGALSIWAGFNLCVHSLNNYPHRTCIQFICSAALTHDHTCPTHIHTQLSSSSLSSPLNTHTRSRGSVSLSLGRPSLTPDECAYSMAHHRTGPPQWRRRRWRFH